MMNSTRWAYALLVLCVAVAGVMTGAIVQRAAGPGPARPGFTQCERDVRLHDPSLTTSQVTDVCTVAQAIGR